jgi:hypothetical protein
LIDVAHVSPCYAYRDRAEGESDQATPRAWPTSWTGPSRSSAPRR